MRVTNATLQATERAWRSSVSNEWIPACLIQFHVASPRTADEAGDGNIRLFKRMADLAKQSTEVADMLQTMYAAYHEEPANKPAPAGTRVSSMWCVPFRVGNTLAAVLSGDAEQALAAYFTRG